MNRLLRPFEMDLSLLPMLEVLLVEQNVTRAARRLEMSQSALSHALARARTAFGDPLLVKAGRGLIPTRRAEALLPALRRVLEQARALREPSVNPLRLRRSFRLATSDSGQFMLLPGLVERMAREAPDVRLDVDLLPEDLEAALDGAVDVVVTARTPASPRLRQTVLGSVPLVWIVRDKHPVLRGKVTAARINALPKVLVVPTPRLLGLAQSTLAEGKSSQNVRVRVSQFVIAASLVARSDLACAIDVACASQLIRHFPLRIIPAPTPGKVVVVMHWHEKDERDPSHLWFRRLVKEVASSGMERVA